MVARHALSILAAASRAASCAALCVALQGAALARATTEDEAQARIAGDVAAAQPIVVHVTVALCDNLHQGIVPVPAKLGNGQDPRSNLYWGARYGVLTYLARDAGWTRVDVEPAGDPRILERAAFRAEIPRGDRTARVYLVADAWDGKHILPAISSFLSMARGPASEQVSVRADGARVSLPAGGAAHVQVFVGHNGLMDGSLPRDEGSAGRDIPASSIVLACRSKAYFLEPLRDASSHPLLLTTGLMAPEAYTLDAAVRAWIGGGAGAAVREAAAAAYDTHQKCGLRAARRLFWTDVQAGGDQRE